jgi:cytochrome c-type protein NapB
MNVTKKIVTAVLVCCLGLFALGGCASSNKVDVNADVPEGASPVMPYSHEGRYADLGAPGCYGCHGNNGAADPMLKQATALPDNHYVNEDRTTMEIDQAHLLCTSCHVQAVEESD